ncbi:hypothetical protein K503DRAFT_453316 [Rhizopogon vinicolor AM-OR11-026]|uniref:Uncharacterized protein n=1 Tax=Rhizopogon vinicolor AM-OR11-026 TaxID=1314800 RepID=A0A1B7MP53_9AGAM|nr:hypothetical protein K503DRAFT_453316 [Rhizopogon vinicolor AM-OR11-026]
MSVVEAAGSAPEGCEMWVREGPVAKKAGGPVISWVDHRVCRVSSEIPSIDVIIFSGEDDNQWYLFSYTPLSNEKMQDLMRSVDTGHSSSVTLRIFHYRQALGKKLYTHFIGLTQTRYWRILSRFRLPSTKTNVKSC